MNQKLAVACVLGLCVVASFVLIPVCTVSGLLRWVKQETLGRIGAVRYDRAIKPVS